MKKMIERIRRLFTVEYRLSVIFQDSVEWAQYKGKRRSLLNIASQLHPVVYWSLYKKGPFNLLEREVDCSLWHK